MTHFRRRMHIVSMHPFLSFVELTRWIRRTIWTRGVVFRNRNGKTFLSNFRVRHPSSPPIGRPFRPPILESFFTNNATRRTRRTVRSNMMKRIRVNREEGAASWLSMNPSAETAHVEAAYQRSIVALRSLWSTRRVGSPDNRLYLMSPIPHLCLPSRERSSPISTTIN